MEAEMLAYFSPPTNISWDSFDVNNIERGKEESHNLSLPDRLTPHTLVTGFHSIRASQQSTGCNSMCVVPQTVQRPPQQAVGSLTSLYFTLWKSEQRRKETSRISASGLGQGHHKRDFCQSHNSLNLRGRMIPN